MKRSIVRLLSLIMVVFVLCSLALPAYADTPNDSTYSTGNKDESDTPTLEPDKPSTDSGDKSEKTDTPKTGEDYFIFLYIGLLGISTIALASIGVYSYRSYKRK